MKGINYEEIADEEGFSVEELQQGYALFLIEEGVEVIQRIDCLEEYGLGKFEGDIDAGKQALKDGYKLFTIKHEDLMGRYILDTPENRKILLDNGYMTKEECGA